MSFLSGIASFGRSAVDFLSGDSFASSLVKTIGLGYAVNRLSTNAIKSNNSGTKNIDQGVRLQISPDSDSKIPVLYGSAFFGGNIFDARMTNNNKTMWYALALSEKTGSKLSNSSATSYVFDDVYWNNQRIVFQSDGITADYAVDVNGTIDNSIRGLVSVYLYAGDATSGQVPDGYTGTVPDAYTVFPNWDIATHPANDLVFALVRVDYSREKNVTGIGDMLFHVTSDMVKPGDVVYDYLTSNVYGLGLDTTNVDSTSFEDLNTYSANSVAYNDEGTGPQTLPNRYQINGLVDTAENVLENAENLCSAAASWLTYDTQEGIWAVVINRAGSSVASFSDDNVLGTVSVGGTGLTDLYNAVKVEFPHRDLRDSADFVKIEIPQADRNANEPDNTLVITYDNINEPVQAELLGFIELKQSRVDLVVEFEVDYSYLGLKAGDIIDLTNSRLNFSGKLFRVITVSESQSDEGISLSITALEYDADVYSVIDITRFTRSNADGIITIGSIGQPSIPQITKFESNARPRVRLESQAPTGVVEAMEFWLSNDVAVAEANRSYRLLTTVRPTNSGTFASGTNVDTEVDTISASEFVIKSRGVNSVTTGPYSDPSVTVVYEPQQITNAIDPDTSILDDTGALATALGIITLLNNIDDIYQGVTGNGSLFDKIFDLFETETGTNLLDAFSSSEPTYTLTKDASVVVEGGSFTVTLATTNVADGTDVPYTITGVSSSDINGASLTGNFTITAGTAEITFNVSEDGAGDSGETFTLELDNIPDKSVSVVFNETENEATYTLSRSTDSVNEGDPFTISLSTVNVPDGTNIDYSISGVNTSRVTPYTPFSGGNRFTIQNGADSIEFTVDPDDNDTVETFTLTLESGESISVQIDEPPVIETYNLYPAGSSDYDIDAERVTINGSYYIEYTGTFYGPFSQGEGNATMYRSDGTVFETLDASQSVINGNVIELPFSTRETGTDYYIVVDRGYVKYCNSLGESVGRGTGVEPSPDWRISTAYTSTSAISAPSPTISDITDDPTTDLTVITNDTNNCPSTTATLFLRLSHFYDNFVGGNFRIKGPVGVTDNVVISGTVEESSSKEYILSSQFDSTVLQRGVDYEVEIDAGVVEKIYSTSVDCYVSEIVEASKAASKTYSVRSATSVPTYIGFSVTPNTSSANRDTEIVIEVDKNGGIGPLNGKQFELYKADGTLIQTFAPVPFSADGTPVTVDHTYEESTNASGNEVYTLNPTTVLESGETYYVITSPDTWRASCEADGYLDILDPQTIRFTVA